MWFWAMKFVYCKTPQSAIHIDYVVNGTLVLSTQPAQLSLAALQIVILYLNTMDTTFTANCNHFF